jgi:CheY-like chemotaxis protein
VKFTSSGGEITLAVSLIDFGESSESEKADEISQKNDNTPSLSDVLKNAGSAQPPAPLHAECEFIVKDNGIGIRKERLQKIFEPFEQADESTIRQYGGTGLGLPISSSYIALLGGQMEIESEPGMGTTFTFTIPVTVTPIETRGNEAADGKQVNLSGRRILIAEDDELNMEIAQTLLEKSGFAVEGAENGRVAVDKFCASKPGYYDAILMDIRMPVLDGLAAAAEIRACDHPDAKSITILALSANAFAEDVKISKQAGMNDHIIKPLDMRVLLKKLEEFLQ